jgi:vitamin B12/bleomycin/antimicrobial peptide transport system ATP-binding/permease protein
VGPVIRSYDVDTQNIPLKITAMRFVRAVKNLMDSEAGRTAKLMFAGLVALLCGVNGLNVVNSYVGRNFMTAIADRNMAEFAQQAVFYIGVFAASTVVAVIARFTEERLGLLWREFLTRPHRQALSRQRNLPPFECFRGTHLPGPADC